MTQTLAQKSKSKDKHLAFSIIQKAASLNASVVVLFPRPDGTNEPLYVDGKTSLKTSLVTIDTALAGKLDLVAIHYNEQMDRYKAWRISRRGEFVAIQRHTQESVA